MSLNGNGNGAGPHHAPLEHNEVKALAEAQALAMLGLPLDDALAMVDRGELDGTAAEAEMKMLRFLLSE